jgi:hypothetical protein
VRVLHDAILHSEKGNSKGYADLEVATRKYILNPQIGISRPINSGFEQNVQDTAPAHSNPATEYPKKMRAVLIDGVPAWASQSALERIFLLF